MHHASAPEKTDMPLNRVVRDTTRAARVEQALTWRRALTRPEARREAGAAAADEAEDFWDNVPV